MARQRNFIKKIETKNTNSTLDERHISDILVIINNEEVQNGKSICPH